MSQSGSSGGRGSGGGRSSQIVDHTYRDFSHYLEHAGQVDRHKKVEANFPAKLHQMLSDPQFSHIIVWMPHGRAWRIVDKEHLIANINKYFTLKRFHSFIRQLSGWGFKRLHQTGPDHGCYYHECFLRGIPRLTWLMRRVPTNTGKPIPHIDGEPDFYEIAKMHPLPPVTDDQPSSHTHSTARPADSATLGPVARGASARSSMARPGASAATTRTYPTSISQIYSSQYGQQGMKNQQSSTEKAAASASESTTESSMPETTFYSDPNSRSQLYSNYGQSMNNPFNSEYRARLSAANNMASSTTHLPISAAANIKASGQNTFFPSSRDSNCQLRSDNLSSWETGATNSTLQTTSSNTAIQEPALQTDTITTSTNYPPAYFNSLSTNTPMMTNIQQPTLIELLSAPSFNNFQPNPYHQVDNSMFPSHFSPGDPLSYNPYFYPHNMDVEEGPASWSFSSTTNYSPQPPPPFYSSSYPPTAAVNPLHFDSSGSYATTQQLDYSINDEQLQQQQQQQQRQELSLSPLFTVSTVAPQDLHTNEQEQDQEVHRKDKEPSDASSGNEDLDFFGSLDF